ncbi:MAG: hflX [Ignavibacteria bacterium]|nr:hflX [Ignavibacteria bacterium]
MHENINPPEKTILISVTSKGSDRELAIEHLTELELLAETAGAHVTEKIYQELEKPNPSFVVGKGKLEEIRESIRDGGVSSIIFDDDLTPAQVRNLERELDVKALDRSGLILDIFASRAKSLEAKTQVELAQLQYMLPRLSRMWQHLSKQLGGIGTKGPGETQIETDRRLIREKITKLKEKLNDIETQHQQQRKGRENFPRFALVGYTNAGKSTLMNAMTNSGVYVEDKLFATLDTTTRAFALPDGTKALLSDTVGFIRKLPAHLVASFRSTLAEARECDVLIHVVDITNTHYEDQIRVVNETLESLKIANKPTVLALNKIDVAEDKNILQSIAENLPNSVPISAKRSINILKLLDTLQSTYSQTRKSVFIRLPYSDFSRISDVYRFGNVIVRRDTDTGIEFELEIFSDKQEYFNREFENLIC